MLIRRLLIALPMVVFLHMSAVLAANKDGAQETQYLSMSDGQLVSHPIRVGVINVTIHQSNHPKLILLSNNDSLQQEYATSEVFPDQFIVGKNNITLKGTLLLFNLSGSNNNTSSIVPWYKTGTRVTPVVEWCDSAVIPCPENKTRKILGGEEVYIGDMLHAIIVTLLAIGVFFILLAIILNSSKERSKGNLRERILSILCDSKRELSLSLTQMALWTLAIGGTTTIFGLTRLTVPEIPDSLVALMGMSLGTTVLGHKMVDRSWQVKKAANHSTPQLSDLLMVHFEGPNGEVEKDTSLAKAQLLFWTLFILFMFVVKSLVEGVLWDVPWQMVVLMGMSQGGYVFRDHFNLNTEKEGPKPHKEKK